MSLKVARGVWMVGGPELSAEGDASIYLVDGEESAALIDAGTGYGVEEVLINIDETGVAQSRIKHLILTHCHIDHSGGVPHFQERLGVKAIAHERGAEILARGNDPRTQWGQARP